MASTTLYAAGRFSHVMLFQQLWPRSPVLEEVRSSIVHPNTWRVSMEASRTTRVPLAPSSHLDRGRLALLAGRGQGHNRNEASSADHPRPECGPTRRSVGSVGRNNLVAAPLGTSELVSPTISPGKRLRLKLCRVTVVICSSLIPRQWDNSRLSYHSSTLE